MTLDAQPVRLLALLPLALLNPRAAAQEVDLEFREAFALAEDRAKALELLVPGTPEHSFHACLERQGAGDLEGAQELLDAWIRRHGRSERTQEIENRQLLLGFDRDPAGTFERLARRLSLRFDHQRQVPGAPSELPTALDPALLEVQARIEYALLRHRGTLDGFRDSGLPLALQAVEGDMDLLRSLLARLERPDLPGLPGLVVRELRDRRSGGFGSLPVHSRLLLAQLEECARQEPELLASSAFVETWLRRLAPGADADVEHDAAQREAWLGELERFVQRLPATWNSLKAHVLHHRLRHDLEEGRPDRARFEAYLALPRRTAYTSSQQWKPRADRGEPLVQFGQGFPTGLPAVDDDEALVRSYLQHFFRLESRYEAWRPWIEERYLRRLFAETRILDGVGDMRQWYDWIDDPAYYEQLLERVEIEFAPTMAERFAPEEPVVLEVDVKNVETLLVKVFEIDAYNYYRERQREVDVTLDLDGLVPGEERVLRFEEGPLLRVRRSIELPSLAGPGVWVVELVGGGTSSRTVVHKGRLSLVERQGSAGHVLRLFDERGRHVREATVWLGGREYAADESGEVLVPYTTDPGTRPVVLRGAGITSLGHLRHAEERYALEAGVFLEREQLQSGERVRVLVRPDLRVNGERASLALLEDPRLIVSSLDERGTPARLEVTDLALSSDGELVHELRVPEGLRQVSFELTGRVRSLSEGEEVALSSGESTFPVAGIDSTKLTASPLLLRSSTGYVLELRGKNGEPRAGQEVGLGLVLRDFADDLAVQLQTDGDGRVVLGELPGVRQVYLNGFPAVLEPWEIEASDRTYPERVHGLAGDDLRVPAPEGCRLERRHLGLFELRGGVPARDAFDSLALADGYVVLEGLAPGDYQLRLEQPGRTVGVSVTAGEARQGWLAGSRRLLERTARPMQVLSAGPEGEQFVVRLDSVRPDARVHVWSTRYLPAYDPFESLRLESEPAADRRSLEPALTTYAAGRAIGEEYRYILERRYAQKFPGNMLPRPSLLLNRWALEDSLMGSRLGGRAGGRYGGGTVPGPRSEDGRGQGRSVAVGNAPSAFADLDFLPAGPGIAAGLDPDADGVARLPLADLGTGSLVHVLVLDGRDTLYTRVVRGEQELVPVDQRFLRVPDPDRPLVGRRAVDLVRDGEAVRIEDPASARVAVYDTLAGVFELYRTLVPDPELARFEFLVRWPELEREERLRLYGEHACHELNLFLHEKDPAFFAEVVRPYLENKRAKTFLDEWLLGRDLVGHLEPWAFARLNLVERLLLVRRIEGRGEQGVRMLEDLLELQAPDLEREAWLFEAALGRAGLEQAEGIAGKVLEYRGVSSRAQDSGPTSPGPTSPGAPPAESEDEISSMLGSETITLGQELVLEDADRRGRVRALFRDPDDTQVLAERDWWHLRPEQAGPDLVPPSRFWLDLARSGDAFLSPHFAEATHHRTEALLALALLDLPFEAGEHADEEQGGALVLRPASPLLLVSEELRPAGEAEQGEPVLVRQNLFRDDDRYRMQDGRRVDRLVEGELLVHVVYGAQVVVTNPTSTPREVDILTMVPAGAVPVQDGLRTQGVRVAVGPFQTERREYRFYFPAPGRFPHYPVQVSERGERIGGGEARTLEVVSEPTVVDTSSWEHVSQLGTTEEVLEYLARANPFTTDLARIAWRMGEREVFDSVLALLRERMVFDATLWSYGIRHQDPRSAGEYLEARPDFLRGLGRALDSPLVSFDALERGTHQHLEFDPLFHARAHPIGDGLEILDLGLRAQYADLLDVLAYHWPLTDDDRLAVTYYLLLQDRVAPALEVFAAVDPGRLETRLQYDYLRCYLAFYGEDPSVARGLAEGYREHPVPHWRERFAEVLRQLDEARGLAGGGAPGDSREARQEDLVASEPVLELAVRGRSVEITHAALEACQVGYYPMDIELLFSTSPFVQQGSGSFAWVRPARSERIDLTGARGPLVLDLPDEFRSSNVLVEVRGAGRVRRVPVFASSLDARWTEAYGQVAVYEEGSGRPLPRTYVKVYARDAEGNVRFHKDGYTDLRGRFDYVSVSGPARSRPVERYSVLLLHEERGAVVREVAPPQK